MNLELWKEELGAGLDGDGGGEEGEAEEMGMISGEGEGRARPLEADELPLQGTPLLRVMAFSEVLLRELGRLPMKDWETTGANGSTTGRAEARVNRRKECCRECLQMGAERAILSLVTSRFEPRGDIKSPAGN